MQVGDLSRKYGLLNGKDSLSETYTDFNLPLFGWHSVLGRSLVIHRDQTGGPRWICANVRDTAASTFALATFTFPVIGHALLRQRLGEDGEGETSVYVELDYGDGSTVVTVDHGWAVHVHPAGDDALSESASERCASAGGDVYDPAAVSASGYEAQCSPSDPLRCRLGDLKGKHGGGGLTVRRSGSGSASTRSRAFFTDVNLPLQGVRSVVGRALVLKGAGGSGGNLACANVLKVWPRQALARSWGGGEHGAVTFTQRVGVVQEPTSIRLELSAMPADVATSYRVDTAPVAATGQRCADLGGAFNPFEVTFLT